MEHHELTEKQQAFIKKIEKNNNPGLAWLLVDIVNDWKRGEAADIDEWQLPRGTVGLFRLANQHR